MWFESESHTEIYRTHTVAYVEPWMGQLDFSATNSTPIAPGHGPHGGGKEPGHWLMSLPTEPCMNNKIFPHSVGGARLQHSMRTRGRVEVQHYGRFSKTGGLCAPHTSQCKSPLWKN